MKRFQSVESKVARSLHGGAQNEAHVDVESQPARKMTKAEMMKLRMQ